MVETISGMAVFANETVLREASREAKETFLEKSPIFEQLDTIKNNSLESIEARNQEKLNAMQEGTEVHKRIQDDEIESGRYDQKEVRVTDKEGNIIERERNVLRGPDKGEIKKEGSVYDLYKEERDRIKTCEIKPFTESGIYEAEKKLMKQKDLEENYGGNKGKLMEREVLFYNPDNKEIILRGDYENTLQRAKDLISRNFA